MTLYRTNEPHAEEIHELVEIGMLTLVEPQECRLIRSTPLAIGSGEVVYEIKLMSDKPANSLTMHNKVWLIGGNDE